MEEEEGKARPDFNYHLVKGRRGGREAFFLHRLWKRESGYREKKKENYVKNASFFFSFLFSPLKQTQYTLHRAYEFSAGSFFLRKR